MEKFYYVTGEGRGVPTVKHKTEVAAYNEAVRLARQCPNVIFHVLEAKRSVKGEIYVTTAYYTEAGVAEQVDA